jgi:precorrin-6B methylase 1
LKLPWEVCPFTHTHTKKTPVKEVKECRNLEKNIDKIMMLTDNYNVEKEIIKFLKTLGMQKS